MTEFLINFSDAEVAAIRAKWQDKTLGNKALTDAECDGGIDLCRRYGAHPLRNQMIPMKFFDRESKQATLTWITSIDMMRVGAHRTGAFAGMDDFEPEYDAKGSLIACRTHVYRMVQGVRCSFPGVAIWDELFSEKGLMSRKMPRTWIDKCAEASALRRAFPLECGNLYLREEIKTAEAEAGDGDETPQKTVREVPQQRPDKTDSTANGAIAQTPTAHNLTTLCQLVQEWTGCDPDQTMELTKAYLKAKGVKGGKTTSPEFQKACQDAVAEMRDGTAFGYHVEAPMVKPKPAAQQPAASPDQDEEAGF